MVPVTIFIRASTTNVNSIARKPPPEGIVRSLVPTASQPPQPPAENSEASEWPVNGYSVIRKRHSIVRQSFNHIHIHHIGIVCLRCGQKGHHANDADDA